MEIKRIISLPVCIIIFLCFNVYASLVIDIDSDFIEQSKEVYIKQCAVCHGENGDGDTPIIVEDKTYDSLINCDTCKSLQSIFDYIQSNDHYCSGDEDCAWKIAAYIHYTQNNNPLPEIENNSSIANAGGDQVVAEGNMVTLSGSRSSGADGNELTFSWSFISIPDGSQAILSDPASVYPTFWADVAGTYTVELIVNDGNANSSADNVITSASSVNIKPIAVAGKDQVVTEGYTITFDGSGSSDADDDELSFSWFFISKPDESSAILYDTKTANSNFRADVAGTYTVQLIVNDGNANSIADSVVISASARNTIP
jgi:hypothetical protein